jgi:hypothetical protein
MGMVFTVQLRLLASSEGGQHSPIASGYRPSFDIGNTHRGESMLNDGQIKLTVGELLPPGEEATATIEPLRPEYWDHVRAGMTIPVMEGSRIVGYARVSGRVWPTPFTPAVAAFVRAAYDFCAFVVDAEKLALDDRLVTAREQLLALYAAATRLPDVEKVTDLEAPRHPVPERWPGFERCDGYWEVFDPYEPAEPVAGSLDDDVLDVYHDTRRGLWLWEKNAIADAVWEWRFSFESHWGDHAIDALRALHRACLRSAR